MGNHRPYLRALTHVSHYARCFIYTRTTGTRSLCSSAHPRSPVFYSSLRGPSCRVANDLRHCALRRLTPPFVFFYYLALRAPDRGVSA